MDIKTLELFENLASTLHFGRTAEVCHLSPSAVSRQIQKLEEHWNCRLFERDNRHVSLTVAGRSALAEVEEILDRWRSLGISMQRDGTELRGEVSIYCSVTASHSLISGMLAQWRRRQPGVELQLHTGDEAHAISRVMRGDEDLAIAAQPKRLAERVSFMPLATTPLVFIAPRTPSPALELLQQAGNRPERMDWARVPMIVPESGVGRQAIEDWYQLRGIRPYIYSQVLGNEALVSMVSLGFGIGIVPLLVLRGSPMAESVQVLAVDQAPAPFTIGLCCLRRSRDKPIVQAFWELAAEIAPLG